MKSATESQIVPNPTVKLVLLGDTGAGKTCLVNRFCHKKYLGESHLPTIGVDHKMIDLKTKDLLLKAMVWDTSGQERFDALSKTYYQNAHGVILVFSLTDKESFLHVNKWMDRIKNEAPEHVSIILVGNKSDDSDNRAVDFQEAKSKAKNLGLHYLEVSARDGSGVSQVFGELANSMAEHLADYKQENSVRISKNPSVASEHSQKPQGSKCSC